MLRNRMKLKPWLSKNDRGVTLIEVIAVIAVMSVVMAAVTGFMITGAKMSAQVSGGATASMREQTATEYINQRLWEVKPGQLEVADEIKDGNGMGTGHYATLVINGKKLFTDAETGKVVYNRTENTDGVALCNGDIYFQKIDNNTVIYVLNGTKHVVHVRIASGN